MLNNVIIMEYQYNLSWDYYNTFTSSPIKIMEYIMGDYNPFPKIRYHQSWPCGHGQRNDKPGLLGDFFLYFGEGSTTY